MILWLTMDLDPFVYDLLLVVTCTWNYRAWKICVHVKR